MRCQNTATAAACMHTAATYDHIDVATHNHTTAITYNHTAAATYNYTAATYNRARMLTDTPLLLWFTVLPSCVGNRRNGQTLREIAETSASSPQSPHVVAGAGLFKACVRLLASRCLSDTCCVGILDFSVFRQMAYELQAIIVWIDKLARDERIAETARIVPHIVRPHLCTCLAASTV